MATTDDVDEARVPKFPLLLSLSEAARVKKMSEQKKER
jgi:hypothetical protein